MIPTETKAYKAVLQAAYAAAWEEFLVWTRAHEAAEKTDFIEEATEAWRGAIVALDEIKRATASAIDEDAQ